MVGATEDPKRMEGRERLVVYLVALTGFMVVLDANIVNVALPSIAHQFGMDTGRASGVVLGYLMVLTAGLLPSGKLIEGGAAAGLFRRVAGDFPDQRRAGSRGPAPFAQGAGARPGESA
jgi:MFS family permease